MNTALGLIAVLVLVGANAFFVAVEFALVAIDRARVAVFAESGKKPWPLVSSLVRRLSFNLSGAQMGITLSSLLLGFIMKPVASALLNPILEPFIGEAAVAGVGVGLAAAIATVLHMVLGELVPKNVAIADPEGVMRYTARPMSWYNVVAGPVVRIANGSANAITRKLGYDVVEELHSISSLIELEHVIRSSGQVGTIDARNVTLLTRSIRFSEKTVADVLVPRVELIAIGVGGSVKDVAALAVESGHSRFVVYGEDLDDVRGVVHVKSVHKVALLERATTPVSEIMRNAFVVPEARDLESMLFEMRRTREQLAVVVDEHGGTAGIVTIEDIVEEIVGEIDDEYDESPVSPVVREIDSVVLAASLHPDEIEEASGFVMPDGDFETLAGFALDQLQRIPSVGEIFEWNGWIFEVTEMDRWRVASLRLTKPEVTDE